MPSTSPDQKLENAFDPVLLCSSDGSINWLNAAAVRLFAADRAATLKLAQFMPEADLQRILHSRHHATFPVQIWRSGDAALTLAQTVFVLELGGLAPGDSEYLLTLKSMPSEDALMAERELCLAAAVHDLKNPVGAIFGYSDLLLDTEAGQGLSEGQRKIVTRIRVTALRAIELIRNYQYISRLEYTSSGQQAARANLHTILDAVLASTWRDETMGPALKVSLAGRPLIVRLETVQLERLLANLIGNALKYTPASGQIQITTSLEGEDCCFTINNRPGAIPAADQEHIFKRYRRSSAAGNKQGSGLGLFIVKQVVDAAGGRIELTSNAENGTTFKVLLPGG